MIALILKENNPLETRVAASPSSVKDMIKFGLTVQIDSGAGVASFMSDDDYSEAGAEILKTGSEQISKADIILKVMPPTLEEIANFKSNSIFISFFQTTRELSTVKALAEKSVTGFSMHLIPRTTLAQKMDALSSQTNIAGYKAVLMAATRLGVYMPLLMTAAGTIRPAKVLILGAGVAGLQAIATAKRLGAQVEVFDVRPVVKEQVESLGAKFIEVESESEDGVGEGGYAKETSDDYKQRQQEMIHEHISKSNIVITTALIPGRPAPLLIPTSMVEAMKPGSVIMDLAAENGGNCELTQKDKIIEHNQVTIDGTSNIPGLMPVDASELYSKNITAFLTYMVKEGQINLDREDEIISGALFTHEGDITHKPTQEALNA
ncbi:MAG: Re/Si-specific NAD(P)(+) transhydrogenase subunit alpha [Candidatus Marinimicrobia bacterium]|jgi:NAD(P) transhydrogenase subunit alpha|nr:Re/Si-specific NAD(P)(+) transhydrogenase subunit alpha [Candidatus Neomarinimicrobiota bacterium]MBT3839351.1 Re/Si-specific NAD(P)(+) transhydrogenase subunit alpha [Candidatus Neomarinimicrobiota bacterium]MBT4000409.1 Re/Si-specific NAD(P)(+) transhydrogenase subunit alpha [Candidatus Neomarinimicrobiota bacterium]MBT4579751.1 Re/Si-specific NAD(P)(+) transhydrogenase subunit alpha [Candidatus Neomarinimicrobiota bacterium]MBT4956761.1 Re/Si-specific NAD(P)(+) transhydrogenase subunit al